MTLKAPARRITIGLLSWTLLFSLAAVLAVPTPAAAATITVTTTTDNFGPDGLCSLREAVASANGDFSIFALPPFSLPGECAAGSGADTIVLAPNSTYTLGSGQLAIDSTITVTGSNTIIDALGSSRVLFVDTNGELTIDQLVITGGNSDFGAGIRTNGGLLNVNNSTISGNTATNSGAGIYVNGPALVTESTISNNDATVTGGGIYHAAGVLTVANSTISGNTASTGGGLHNNDNSVTFEFTTITDNTASIGAGVSSYGDNVTASHAVASIIAGNNGTDLSLFNGAVNSFSSGGFNVIGTGSPNIAFSQAGDIVGVTNPGLGNLNTNGGPTLTHAILAGSPAIARVTGSLPGITTDQRGSARPAGAQDSGSYEFDDCSATTYVAANTNQLNAAIGCYNAATTNNHVINVLNDIVYSGTSNPINNTTPGVTLTIEGDDNTLDANDSGRVLTIANGDVTLNDITITGGITTAGGGGIENSGTLTVANSTISDNAASFGGGIASGGTATVVNSTITGNTADFGGGIYNFATTTVVNSTVSGNTAVNGGGVFNETNTVNLDFVTVTDNTAPDGAGVQSEGNNNTFTNVAASIIAGNNGDDVVLYNGTTNSFVSNGYNVTGSGSGNSAFSATADTIEVVDPSLGPLAANGGLTDTHALLSGSAAINRVTDAFPLPSVLNDQRGEPRTLGTRDSGALEVATANAVVFGDPCVVYNTTVAGGVFVGGETRTISVSGCIPAGTTSVIATITAINPQTTGNLRLSQAGVIPNGGVVNYTNNGLNNANTVTIPVTAALDVDITANSTTGLPSTDVRLAIVGYHKPGNILRYTPITPCAVHDSRSGTGTHAGPFTAASTIGDIDVRGTFPVGQGGGNATCGIPANAAAVNVNVVAVAPTGGTGYLTAGHRDANPTEPLTNYTTQPLNNATTTTIPLFNDSIALDHFGTGTTHTRVVALGYYTATGSSYTPVNACAAFDTRTGQGAAEPFLGQRDAGTATTYTITGAIPAAQGGNGGDCQVPTTATAVLINLVAIQPNTTGNFRAYATGSTPTGGVLNFAPTTPPMNNSNAVIVPLSTFGQLDVFINAPANTGNPTTHIRGIILGYYN